MSLEETIGYSFERSSFLKDALTHPSVSRHAKAFERLEFLGDRVLGLVVAAWVYECFPKESEGDLTKRFASLVSRESCAQIAKDIILVNHLKIFSQDAVEDTHILSDAIEALIGAIYLDGGMDPCHLFIRRFWENILYANKTPPKDAKSTLQEWAQSRNIPLPVYQLIRIEGPDHSPTFWIEACIQGYASEQASGAIKRVAEQAAAKQLLQKLKKK